MGCPTACEIGDAKTLTFSICTHDPDTGVLTDADAVPDWFIYEDETGAAIANGSMAKLDDANTTGFYADTVTTSAANGYEHEKTYTVYIEATVDGDQGGISYGFKAVDARATAAKLVAYIQLLARSDEAIETDNATELGEINADGGSGIGTFNNELHSGQGIRVRGDIGWLTGSGGGSTGSHTEDTNWTRTVGDNDGGTPADTISVDGTYFSTGETNAGAYLQVDVVFDITDGEIGTSLDLWGFYNGGSGHQIQVLALDTASSQYEPIGEIPSTSSVVINHPFKLSDGHTNTTTDAITIRFLHQGGTGNASHVFSVDKAQVNVMVPATASNIADEVLARAVQNVEDTADKHSLGAMVMIATNASVSASTLTAKKPSDDSTFFTYTITVDASANPITGVS